MEICNLMLYFDILQERILLFDDSSGTFPVFHFGSLCRCGIYLTKVFLNNGLGLLELPKIINMTRMFKA
jgi:hypothetical protein